MGLGHSLGAVSAAVILILCSSSSFAQDGGKNPPSNPVGAGWGSTTVKPSGEVGGAFSQEQLAAIERVSTYFNELSSLVGRFVQTDPDGNKTDGNFYVKRPGKFRFEYDRPSTKVVVSDGRFLAIEERAAGTEETYELSDTPFRMLLRADVNLTRDSEVLLVEETDSQIALVLRDKDPDIGSAIKVVMTKEPELNLRGWITRDAQGLETIVEVADLKRGEKIEDQLFERGKFFLEKVQQR